jgi:hypothetical protein
MDDEFNPLAPENDFFDLNMGDDYFDELTAVPPGDPYDGVDDELAEWQRQWQPSIAPGGPAPNDNVFDLDLLPPDDAMDLEPPPPPPASVYEHGTLAAPSRSIAFNDPDEIARVAGLVDTLATELNMLFRQDPLVDYVVSLHHVDEYKTLLTALSIGVEVAPPASEEGDSSVQDFDGRGTRKKEKTVIKEPLISMSPYACHPDGALVLVVRALAIKGAWLDVHEEATKDLKATEEAEVAKAVAALADARALTNPKAARNAKNDALAARDTAIKAATAWRDQVVADARDREHYIWMQIARTLEIAVMRHGRACGVRYIKIVDNNFSVFHGRFGWSIAAGKKAYDLLKPKTSEQGPLLSADAPAVWSLPSDRARFTLSMSDYPVVPIVDAVLAELEEYIAGRGRLPPPGTELAKTLTLSRINNLDDMPRGVIEHLGIIARDTTRWRLDWVMKPAAAEERDAELNLVDPFARMDVTESSARDVLRLLLIELVELVRVYGDVLEIAPAAQATLMDQWFISIDILHVPWIPGNVLDAGATTIPVEPIVYNYEPWWSPSDFVSDFSKTKVEYPLPKLDDPRQRVSRYGGVPLVLRGPWATFQRVDFEDGDGKRRTHLVYVPTDNRCGSSRFYIVARDRNKQRDAVMRWRRARNVDLNTYWTAKGKAPGLHFVDDLEHLDPEVSTDYVYGVNPGSDLKPVTATPEELMEALPSMKNAVGTRDALEKQAEEAQRRPTRPRTTTTTTKVVPPTVVNTPAPIPTGRRKPGRPRIHPKKDAPARTVIDLVESSDDESPPQPPPGKRKPGRPRIHPKKDTVPRKPQILIDAGKATPSSSEAESSDEYASSSEEEAPPPQGSKTRSSPPPQPQAKRRRLFAEEEEDVESRPPSVADDEDEEETMAQLERDKAARVKQQVAEMKAQLLRQAEEQLAKEEARIEQAEAERLARIKQQEKEKRKGFRGRLSTGCFQCDAATVRFFADGARHFFCSRACGLAYFGGQSLHDADDDDNYPPPSPPRPDDDERTRDGGDGDDDDQ